MPTYIIASHGNVKWTQEGTTTVPANTSVLFYTKFGLCIPNDDACKIQQALCRPGEFLSQQTLSEHKTVALWNGPNQYQPEISLTPDNDSVFKSGIVLADTDQVIFNLKAGTLITLTWALDYISKHARGARVDVHCLFCLAG